MFFVLYIVLFVALHKRRFILNNDNFRTLIQHIVHILDTETNW
jgi:hypothetical protein